MPTNQHKIKITAVVPSIKIINNQVVNNNEFTLQDTA